MPTEQPPILPSIAGAYGFQLYAMAAAFHESDFVSDTGDHRRGRHWGDYRARLDRYQTFWAHYDNTVYRRVHLWSDVLKDAYGLNEYVRSVYSPAYRLVEFWATHVYGGPLDPAAGDGAEPPSAIPILCDNPAIRPALAQVWRDSNWQAEKETWPRFGAAMGDAVLMVVDDPQNQKVRYKVIDPRTLVDAQRDAYGNVRSYVIEERRPDPEAQPVGGYPIYALYTETCHRVGDSIRYATYRNNLPYDWRRYPDGVPADQEFGTEWAEPFPFVPLVVVPNRDVGLVWGWSELQPSISKLMELDDLASKLNDWVRIAVDCPWLFTGAVPPNSSKDPNATVHELVVNFPDDDDDDDCGPGGPGRRGRQGRNRIPTVYSPDPASRGFPLLAPLPVRDTSDHIATILTSIQDDHPELVADDVGPQSSGEARKVAREKVEALVVQRRAGYDDRQVRAGQMALSMGAIKQYPGFEAFRPESYDAGELAHAIGPRPVFAVNKAQQSVEAVQRATVLKTMTDAGVPVDVAMEEAGYPPEQVEKVRAKLAADEARANRMADAQAALFGDPGARAGGITA